MPGEQPDTPLNGTVEITVRSEACRGRDRPRGQGRARQQAIKVYGTFDLVCRGSWRVTSATRPNPLFDLDDA